MSFIMNYYRHIDREKIQFDFVYFHDGEETYKSEIEELGGKCYFLGRPSLGSYGRYKRFFEENAHEYHAVHLHEVYLSWFIHPLAKRRGIEHLIIHSHNTKYSDIKLKAMRNRILCVPIKRNANLFLACSGDAGEFLYGSEYAKSGKVKVFNNAIDMGKFGYDLEKRKKLRKDLLLENKLVIGHVGRFAEQKNHKFLFQVFRAVMEKRKDCVLVLLGGHTFPEEYRKKMEELGIEDSVLFLGRKKNIEDYYNAMDVFVFPSIFEGLGIVLIEAQCNGLPCYVSNAVPGEAKISNDYHALDLKDEAGKWADAIIGGISGNRRPGEMTKRGMADFNILHQAKGLEEFYIGLAGGR